MNKKNLVLRSSKVNFMKLEDNKYGRMKYFSAIEEEKNPTEYSRTYVDEDFERVDVVGISSGISFSMDQRTNDPVHDVIVDIFENEKIGDASEITLLSIDFTKPVDLGADDETHAQAYEAKERVFSLIPESEGSEEMAYNYSGSLRVKGNTKFGVAKFISANVVKELDICDVFEENLI